MKKEKLIIAGNWKMNQTVSQTRDFLQKLNEKLDPLPVPSLQLILFPPFTALQEADRYRGAMELGAQNMHYRDSGAFTGEISGFMVRELCRYVLIGHSERRHIFHESEEDIRLKVTAALGHSLIPVLCLGEKEDERDAGHTFKVIRRQLDSALKGLDSSTVGKIILAYEPVWAIGTGRTASPEQAAEVHEFIQKEMEPRIGVPGNRVPVLYGGSVKPGNCMELLSREGIDGALIGGASLKVESFFDIILNSIDLLKS